MNRPRFAAVFTLALAAAAVWAPAGMADPQEAAPPPTRTLYASPLVTIEQIGGPGGGAGMGFFDGDGADGRDGPPLDLAGPDAFTTFPQVAPPDGGGLVTLVE